MASGKIIVSGEFANKLLLLIFNATPYANMADNAATSPFTNLYMSLHTANPSTTAGGGTVNTQSASESQYTSYARIAVARTSGGFTVTANSVSPASNISFITATGGSEVATFWGIGSSISGNGHLLYYGSILPTITISNGVQPILLTSSTITES